MKQSCFRMEKLGYHCYTQLRTLMLYKNYNIPRQQCLLLIRYLGFCREARLMMCCHLRLMLVSILYIHTSYIHACIYLYVYCYMYAYIHTYISPFLSNALHTYVAGYRAVVGTFIKKNHISLMYLVFSPRLLNS